MVAIPWRFDRAGCSERPDVVNFDGSAVLIHASPDDHMAQPIGGAGARVACGEIR